MNKLRAGLLLMMAGMLPSCPALAEAPLPAEAAQAFAPPLDRPMRLSRTVIRELPDGARIVATRRYRVRFMRAGEGYRISGTLVASEMEAPDSLRPLAEMERARPDDIFPIMLDAAGRIVSQGGAAANGEGSRGAVNEALAMVEKMLAQRPDERGPEQDAFLARLRVAAGAPLSAHWPAQLFVARGADRLDRTFALPGGGQGRFLAEVTKQAGEGGVTAMAERRIVTSVGGEDSVSVERWALAPEG